MIRTANGSGRHRLNAVYAPEFAEAIRDFRRRVESGAVAAQR